MSEISRNQGICRAVIVIGDRDLMDLRAEVPSVIRPMPVIKLKLIVRTSKTAT